MDKYEAIKEFFGHASFREGQEQIIDSLLSGKDVVCVMPTGAGKSICYQVPALVFTGVTIVISPLISLMKDQVNSLTQSGVKAAYINSSLTFSQCTKVVNCAREGKYKIIYVAPERLLTESFLELCSEIKISMIAIDEAHCISQWGQDFRPNYLKISEFLDRFKIRPVVGAFTATATKEVKEDIETILNLQNPYKITTGFDRPNLYFSVVRPSDKDSFLLKHIKAQKDKSGIIYCSTRKAVEQVCDMLNLKGYDATRYHAGLDDKERKINQDDFIYDRKTIMVATNAFGMGIDKSNVSYVIHYNMPMNIESYYQEAGRAGRDGQNAECILLYSGADVRLNQYLIKVSEPNPDLSEDMQKEIKERDKERLKYMTFYCTTDSCLRAYILKYFGDKSDTYCGKCTNCEQGFELSDVTVESQKILSCIYRTKQKYGIKMIVDILKGSRNARLLKAELDKQTTYGIMRDIPESIIRAIIDYLIIHKYIEVTDNEYPSLVLKESSSLVLKSQTKLEMKVSLFAKKEDRVKEYIETDYNLLSKLKELRLKLSKEARVPAYIIFTDKSLEEMCKLRPKNISEFLKVPGVSIVKQQKFGKRFIDIINEL